MRSRISLNPDKEMNMDLEAWSTRLKVFADATRVRLLALLAREELTVAGDGSQTRSVCFVDDLVRGCGIGVARIRCGTGVARTGRPVARDDRGDPAVAQRGVDSARVALAHRLASDVA